MVHVVSVVLRILNFIVQPLFGRIGALSNVAIFHHGEESISDEIVANPDPDVAEKKSHDVVDRSQIVIQVLHLVTIHRGPKHNHGDIKGPESITLAKPAHAKEGDTNHHWHRSDHRIHDSPTTSLHRARQDIIVLAILQVLHQ